MASTTDAQWRPMLLDLYAVDRSPAVDLIRAMPGTLRGYATYDIPTVPTWHNAPMVVIGDAAHAASPSSGQGASMAIEDAGPVARVLRDLMMPLFLRGVAGNGVSSLAWMHRYHIDRDAPVAADAAAHAASTGVV